MGRKSETINVGVADIFYTPVGGTAPADEIYLGLTKGGAVLEYEGSYHDITADQTGETTLDSVLIGEKVNAKFSLLDTTLDSIHRAAPTATREQDTSGGAPITTAVTFGQAPGLRLGNVAGMLRIHPISAGMDTSFDVIIYRAANKAKLELAWKLDDEWVIPCEYVGIIDDLRMPGDQLFRIGSMDNAPTGSYKRIVSFWLTPSSPTQTIGSTQQFDFNVRYDDGTMAVVNTSATWSSSAPTIASVNSSGLATAVTTGVTVITASLGAISVSTTLTVS